MEEPLLAALFGEEERQPSSVTDLNSEIKSLLERTFASVWVEGEITNFHAAASGHWYFSLTDGNSFIKAACFKGQNFRIRFKPADGLLVRVRGRITTYSQRGEYQIVVESLEPVGEGALAVAFEQIKAKLAKEGLFDPELKRPLPPFPRRVGVVTSPTGAAIRDILTVLERRAKTVNVVVIPTLVQGEHAGEQIAAGIALANRFSASAAPGDGIDVLIVGRGGGSAEDLWAFNEEQVARAIRASAIPVISAVGHEVDFTISDLAADLRAPTPSAAAEIVARAESDVIEHLRRTTADLLRSAGMRLLSARADLQSLAMAPVFTEFPARFREQRHRLGTLDSRALASLRESSRAKNLRLRDLSLRLSPVGLARRIGATQERLGVLYQRTRTAGLELGKQRSRKLENAVARLDALSPLRVLDRGYSITERMDGSIVRSADVVDVGENVGIRLASGRIKATVIEIESKESKREVS